MAKRLRKTSRRASDRLALEGICSSPHVEGDLLYFVCNRCEVVWHKIDTGENVWKLDMIKELGVFPHNLSDCSR